MGPYCRFCNQRCFTHMPHDTPAHILRAYIDYSHGDIPIIATCPRGQAFERERVGYCYGEIMAAAAANTAASK